MGKDFFKKLGIERVKQKMTYQKPTVFLGIVEQPFPMQRWTRISLHKLMVAMAQDNFRMLEPYSPIASDNVAITRNEIVSAFLESGADLLLMMDTDIIFPPDAFKLLWTHDQDVSAAITVRTSPPHYPKIGKIVQENGEMMVKQVTDLDVSMSFQLGITGVADCIGLDFALFKRKVFEVLPKPWFYCPKTKAGGGAILGDSWAFCFDAVQKGLSIVADPSIGINIFKIGWYPFSLRDFQLYKEKGWAESVDHMPDDRNSADIFKAKFRGIRVQDGIELGEVEQSGTN